MLVSLPLKKIILIVVIVAALGAVVATGIVVTRSLFSKASDMTPDTTSTVSGKLAPPKAPSKTATPAAAPTPVKSPPPPVASPAALTTTVSNGWTVFGLGSIDATLSFSADSKNLYADFASSNFSAVSSVDYSLVYEDAVNVARLVRGTAVPSGGTIARKVITLGTCSGTDCVYDTGPHNFIFRILVKTNGGLTVNLKTYSLAEIPVATFIP